MVPRMAQTASKLLGMLEKKSDESPEGFNISQYVLRVVLAQIPGMSLCGPFGNRKNPYIRSL